MFVRGDINKKHKGIKKGSTGLGFETFSDRMPSLINFDNFKKNSQDFKEVPRLTLSEGKMQKKKVIKVNFLFCGWNNISTSFSPTLTGTD